jgi:tRNA pseudouridine55 synthase
MDFSGILLIDKPQGITSHDVVAQLRRLLKIKRIGHAGTLDPLATGLLILLIGKATKASDQLMGLDKTYEGTLKLGEITDSQDSEGTIIETRPVPTIDNATFQTTANSFLGDSLQTPPMFSAKKMNGQPLYKLARKGQVIDRPSRCIHITDFTINTIHPPFLSFTINCSKGTYIRTIANDFGQKLETGAHLTALRRTRIGPFSIKNAIALTDLSLNPVAMMAQHLQPIPATKPLHNGHF